MSKTGQIWTLSHKDWRRMADILQGDKQSDKPGAQGMTAGKFLESQTGIGKPIVIGFLAILILMLASALIGLHFVAEANQRLHHIVNNQNVKTRLAASVQMSLAQRALSMQAIAIAEDDFVRDEENLRFDEFAAAYVRARDAIEAMPLNAAEKTTMNEMRELTRITRREWVAVQALFASGQVQAMRDKLRMGALPKQRRISEKADEFMRLQQRQADTALGEADASYAQAKLFMWMISFCTIAFGFLITYFVRHRVNTHGRQLHVQARYDALTGLPNRLMLLEQLEHKILLAQRNRSGLFLVMLMDLDRFKEVNDTLGHECGDILLKEVGRRLLETIRSEDMVARLGGDEFVLVLNVQNQQDVASIAEKYISVLDPPFSLEQQSVDVGASLGITLYPDHGQSPSTLLREADIAMYVAKRDGLGYALYSAEQDKTSRDDLSLKGELREAIQSNQLVLHYQPKIDHRQHRVVGFEALVRWVHPHRGFMPPDKFIPLAEQAGLIGALTRWVLKAALHQLAEFHAQGHRLSMAVNLSARNLHDPKLVNIILGLLQETGVQPEYLVLEITEGAVMSSPNEGIRNLHRLDDLGITLSIDDFGTGYSSLAYLKQLPVDELKIDKSFVLNMCTDDNDAMIVRSTIDLAHNLGLKVTAEGVENRETLEILTILGCDTSQGYFMSKPQAAEKIAQWLVESPWAIGTPSEYPDADFWLSVQPA